MSSLISKIAENESAQKAIEASKKLLVFGGDNLADFRSLLKKPRPACRVIFIVRSSFSWRSAHGPGRVAGDEQIPP